MKKLFKSYIALAVLALGFSACTEEVEYTPAEVPATAQVYFSNTNGAQIDLAKEAKSFDIAVNRAVTGEAASIEVTVTADSLANATFDFPATVEFADTAATTTYTVTLKEGKELDFEVYYNISLAFDESLATPYGNSTYSFKVGVPAPWTEWEKIGTGTYYLSIYWGGTHSGLPIYYREYLLNDTDAQFYIPGIANSMNLTIEYNRQTGACQVLPQYALTNTNYGQVTVLDIPHYPFTNLSGTYEEYPCYYDEEKGLFTLNLAYVVCTLWDANTNGSFGNGVETFQLDGFKQYDYTYSMEYKGQYVDNSGNCNAIISTTVGTDIPKYLLTVVAEGADLNATISGMLDGTVACDTLTESGFYAYPMTESGVYTALAITFDADGNVNEAYAEEFEFYLAGQENPWVSLGMATYTEDCLTTFFNVANETYSVEIRQNKDNPGLYRMIHPYAAYGAATDKEYYIEIDATDPEGVYIPGIYGTGFEAGYGEVSITSMAYYYMANQGVSLEDVKGAGYCGIFADNVITFPAQALLISMAGYQDGAWYKSNVNGAFKLDMSNMTPVEAAAAKAPAMRNYVELVPKSLEGGIQFGIRAKKIDNSFMVPVNAELK
ncbi:MAG: hypothetical protein E7088_06210 [Bacteroidales bacterium]|nr:hypothetical protein [Bacteroidales bacterium]